MMGWQVCEDWAVGHEGYLRAMDDAGDPVGYPEERKLAVREVCAECECGWRSRRIAAPKGTHYVPYAVVADEATEDRIEAEWERHMARVRRGEPD
jgi:hypothetical protein